ncbi:hypothetical protein [Haladaptatus halobius]|uniref:hypothetical protein n=1 Tax=Haladaptatus halobius TaxID=2884875 RepID=UPI001D09D30C|nr:hypothetical protein [Haladaptatus halobius]
MTEAPDPKEAVTDELTEQVDVSSLMTGDSVAEQVDGASLGRAFGEAVGAFAGRRLGRIAVDRVVSKLPFRSEDDHEGERSPLRRLASAFVVALGRTLRRPQFREPIEDALRGYVEEREEALDEAEKTAQQAAEEAAGTVEEAAGEAADTAEETTEGAATEAKEAAEDVTDAGVGDLTADDVQAIKEETYRELLETMEYSELQSIAKEVGVKANLKREEILDAIVEEFNDGADEDESDAE